MFPGWGNAGRWAVTLYVGEGLRGSNGTCSTLHRISVTPSATYNQIAPLWCWFLSGWACAHSRPLWVSPTTSPVRLGVSPAAAPTPMGVFNQRFEALLPPPHPRAGALGYAVCFAPRHSSWFICARMWGRGVLPTALPAPFSATLSPAISVYLCSTAGPQGLLVVGLPAPFIPHSASLGPTMATGVLSAPVPVSAPPTSLDVCFFFIYLVSDFLVVQFSVSSGCARRRSVSIYAANLVLPSQPFLSMQFRSVSTFTLLYNPSPEPFSSCKTETLCPLNSLLPPPQAPNNHHSTFCLYEFDYSTYCI